MDRSVKSTGFNEGMLIVINNKNRLWLKNGVIAIVFALLFSCSNASHNVLPTGVSRLITETCPKKLDMATIDPTSRVGGTVAVNIQVDKQGKASSIKVVQSSNSLQIDTAVINFYGQCTYTPAKINGRVVRGATMQGYTY